MLCFLILGEKNSRNQFLMNWAKTGQILKIGEEIWIKGLNLGRIFKNSMEELILKDLGEFQWFLAVLEEKKKKKEF